MDNGLTEEAETTEFKKKTRQRNKNNKNSASTTNKLVSNNDTKHREKNSETSKSKNIKKARRRDDRYYGRFHCKNCKRHWESAHVYTVGGTKMVKFRQACKQCKEYYFPYRLQILRCSQCMNEPCTCVCEDCGKLRHKRYISLKISDTDDSEEEEAEDPAYEYCRCDRRKDSPVGATIDPKKNHLSNLCERCQKGINCIFRRHPSDNDLE
ncbi:unnamed protein product [Lymnaea stagnalis]|uniref:3CxxC-type domain-containing protein n=1 Tax=Lymnaea stagnalis TaxID=6523 RepID=A0AAV2HSA1_LYMST